MCKYYRYLIRLFIWIFAYNHSFIYLLWCTLFWHFRISKHSFCRKTLQTYKVSTLKLFYAQNFVQSSKNYSKLYKSSRNQNFWQALSCIVDYTENVTFKPQLALISTIIRQYFDRCTTWLGTWCGDGKSRDYFNFQSHNTLFGLENLLDPEFDLILCRFV